LTASIVALR